MERRRRPANAAAITNLAGAVWTGGVTGNNGTISNLGSWVGNVQGNVGSITTAGV